MEGPTVRRAALAVVAVLDGALGTLGLAHADRVFPLDDVGPVVLLGGSAAAIWAVRSAPRPRSHVVVASILFGSVAVVAAVLFTVLVVTKITVLHPTPLLAMVCFGDAAWSAGTAAQRALRWSRDRPVDEPAAGAG